MTTARQYYVRVERKRRKLERKYEGVLELVFNRQLKSFERAIEENLFGAIYTIDVFFDSDIMQRALERLWTETANEFKIDDFETAITKSVSFTKSINQETWVSLLLQWIATDGGEKITQINRFTKAFVLKNLRPILNEGTQQGLGIPEIAQNIVNGIEEYRGRFAKYRAERIARSEIVSMSNRASYLSAQSADLGDKLQKFWIPEIDDRTRITHAEMQDYPAIPLEDDFIVNRLDGGTDKMAFPGDPRGSAANTISCRCVIGYKRA